MGQSTNQNNAAGALPVYSALVIQNIQVVKVTATSEQSFAVSTTTKYVQLSGNVSMWVSVGANPTAENAEVGNMFVPANNLGPLISVTPGVTKFAAILDLAIDGYLSIIESA